MIYLTKTELLLLERELRSMAFFKEAYTALELECIYAVLHKVHGEMYKRGYHANQGPIEIQFTARNTP